MYIDYSVVLSSRRSNSVTVAPHKPPNRSFFFFFSISTQFPVLFPAVMSMTTNFSTQVELKKAGSLLVATPAKDQPQKRGDARFGANFTGNNSCKPHSKKRREAFNVPHAPHRQTHFYLAGPLSRLVGRPPSRLLLTGVSFAFDIS